ncbi:MAG: monothiol glutaredoxin, Grx4 family [Candidatus Melainabacteria bacterium RIFCSPHIGHO2_02_FULL_34_12]|nr:MAG: monothiol glutaredoxin, Grx4 family [Candidatus Melainabacteria bacterium RIFCSPHIGHO2_02_FULL_34_12]
MSDILKQIDSDVKSNKVIVFMKGTKDAPQCGFSAAVVDVFKALGVDFETRDVLTDNELREGIKKYTNWPTVPQVFVDGKFIGGCDVTREMFQSGELQKLIKSQINT